MAVSILDNAANLYAGQRECLCSPYTARSPGDQLVENVFALNVDGPSVRSYGSRVNIADAHFTGAIRELYIAVAPACLGEDFQPDVDFQACALCRIIVEIALAKENSGFRAGIAGVGRDHFEIFGFDWLPGGG